VAGALTLAVDHLRVQVSQRPFARQVDLERQYAFLGAAPDGQHAVRGNLGGRFRVLGVHLELAFGIFGALDGAAGDDAVGHHHGTHGLAVLGILAHHFGDDVACAFERFRDRGHALFGVDECCGVGLEGLGSLRPKELRQRLQALLARHLGLGAALRLVRQVEVFQLVLLEHRLDLRLQFRRELALRFDRFEDGFATLFELAEVFQLLLAIADLHLVEVAGDFLAVARNERHGGALVEQLHHGCQALERNVQELGYVDENGYG